MISSASPAYTSSYLQRIPTMFIISYIDQSVALYGHTTVNNSWYKTVFSFNIVIRSFIYFYLTQVFTFDQTETEA